MIGELGIVTYCLNVNVKQLLTDTHANLAHPHTPTTLSVPVFVLPGLLFRARHSTLLHSVFLWQISAFGCAAFRDCTANSATCGKWA